MKFYPKYIQTFEKNPVKSEKPAEATKEKQSENSGSENSEILPSQEELGKIDDYLLKINQKETENNEKVSNSELPTQIDELKKLDARLAEFEKQSNYLTEDLKTLDERVAELNKKESEKLPDSFLNYSVEAEKYRELINKTYSAFDQKSKIIDGPPENKSADPDPPKEITNNIWGEDLNNYFFSSCPEETSDPFLPENVEIPQTNQNINENAENFDDEMKKLQTQKTKIVLPAAPQQSQIRGLLPKKSKQPEQFVETDEDEAADSDVYSAPKFVKLGGDSFASENFVVGRVAGNASKNISKNPGLIAGKSPNRLKNCLICKEKMDLNCDRSFNFGVIKNGQTHFDICCEKCRKNLIKCPGCGNGFADENGFVEKHCPECINEGFKKYILPYQHNVAGHSSQVVTPRKSEFKFNSEEAKNTYGENDIRSFVVGSHGIYLKLIGIELEYETVKSYGLGVLSVVNVIKETGLQAKIKRDGTLKAGFEIVSVPADKQYHYEAWRGLFDKIQNDENIYCAPYAPPEPGQERGTGCGCHIHVSREFLTVQETYGKDAGNNGYGLAALKLQTFIHNKNNRQFVELIAGRKSNQFSDFVAHKGLRFDRDHRITGGSEHVTKSAFDHRTAVNFHTSTHKTIEFRIFRSTKDYSELLKNIDFVDAICSFCRTGVASIQQMEDWIYFYEFVCKNRQDFPYLYRFFEGSPEFQKMYKTKVNY